MNFFQKLLRFLGFIKKDPPPVDPILEVVNQLRTWQRQHFPGLNTKKPYDIYRFQSGKTMRLSAIKMWDVPSLEVPALESAESVIHAVQAIHKFGKAVIGNTAAKAAENYHDSIAQALSTFQQNMLMMKNTYPEMMNDLFVEKIRTLFLNHLRQFYLIVQFCQFDRLSEEQYLKETAAKLDYEVKQLKMVNQYMSEYMLNMSSIQYDTTSDDIESIRIAVDAMEEVAEETRQEQQLMM